MPGALNLHHEILTIGLANDEIDPKLRAETNRRFADHLVRIRMQQKWVFCEKMVNVPLLMDV